MFVREYNLCNRMAFDKYEAALAIFHPFLENVGRHSPYLEDKLTPALANFDFSLRILTNILHNSPYMAYEIIVKSK